MTLGYAVQAQYPCAGGDLAGHILPPAGELIENITWDNACFFHVNPSSRNMRWESTYPIYGCQGALAFACSYYLMFFPPVISAIFDFMAGFRRSIDKPPSFCQGWLVYHIFRLYAQ